MRFILVLFIYFLGVSYANAEIISSLPEKEEIVPEVANIYFTDSVSERSISELGASINDIYIKYPTVKKINLIINSLGGSVQAGFMAYTMIKSSPIPITAINGGITASAATYFYCAAKERQAIPGSMFLLHAANTYAKAEKPDELERELVQLGYVHNFINKIYRECTTLSDDEIKNIAKSEYLAKYLDEEEAKTIKLSDKTAQTIAQPDVSFFIFSKDRDE
ncbi:ATP-dependent Clp protease proteolytic subunit [Brucella gallinifaecis]|uniref:ATP-dependent Clp protease proteolytic subunit n=1 Tax=Brucella gallinifaecis TaxID=215590 RepID=UPI00235E22DB|nr:ATP-dependent Clp protease proteolytic subunit [Brucella gallinifaecis]